MKKSAAFLTVVFILLVNLSAYADVAYEPPQTDFYDLHKAECVRIEREYYSNGEKGYIALCKEPEGRPIAYIPNAEVLWVFCTYNDWAMVPRHQGNEPGWVKMSELYLIYDERSFCEEHEDEFSKTYYELSAEADETKKVYIYSYPGAKSPRLYELTNDTLGLGTAYTDPEGRIWGKVFYHYGIRNSWVCYSQPETVVPSFGGDPNLSLLPTKPIPYEEIPDTPNVPEADETPFFEPVEPPARPIDPLVFVAIGLVAVAVLTAGVLIIICYKRTH